DATAHIIQNPIVPHFLDHPVPVTLALLVVLCGIFLKGFKEAIGLAVFLVGVYLLLNVVVLVVALREVARHPEVFGQWHQALLHQHGSVWAMLGAAALLFPKLALGLSGFETGVAVMPLVKGDPGDDRLDPKGRVRNTRHLLRTAALIMSVALIASSLASTLLIPAKEFAEGGQANGRALAYLAHHYLGN